MDADGQPARLGNELFRARYFVVRVDWDGGLEVASAMPNIGEITIKLDQYQARDLLVSLESWRAGEPVPVGPAER